jgi:hypothetical protein
MMTGWTIKEIMDIKWEDMKGIENPVFANFFIQNEQGLTPAP